MRSTQIKSTRFLLGIQSEMQIVIRSLTLLTDLNDASLLQGRQQTDKLLKSLSLGLDLVNLVDGSVGICPVETHTQGFFFFSLRTLSMEEKRGKQTSRQIHTWPAVISQHTA